MKLYVFVCMNVTNIWAGIGSRTWAVSIAQPSVNLARKTRAPDVQVGQAGIIYCSSPSLKSLTTPFLITTPVRIEEEVSDIWPEKWVMPFGIHPLGNPRTMWRAKQAARELPFNKDKKNYNISSVFKTVGTAVFSPIQIGENDWATILEKVGNSR